ncbi:hypothetical protein E0493_12525 [Roseomonas sp. M0104]|uniref:Uncharacterized protein n=1 Tax=Teichococcus coralli TaxID=2545983 RepID=A0A845BDI3_9PROT|nr:hypothetical protein [Pseudoroseomonas coralli]MXP64170.1 hypothetical protein [Pseudoroseomonas coralli]
MRRLVTRLGRWSLRLLFGLALLNLGWDIWAWHDRNHAEGERRFFRAAEQPADIDYGLAEIRIVNETGHDFLIDSFVLDGWGGPYTHEPAEQRTLARAGEQGSVREEERRLDHLLGEGDLVLRNPESGAERLITFQVDRRRPTSCRIELRIQEEGEVVSECQLLPRIRHSFRWLFGSPND